MNDEAVHGIPGRRRLRSGDLVKLDVAAELVAATRRALADGMRAAVAGAPIGAIGTAVERSVRSRGLAVCGALTGHGIGRCLHEAPTVPNVFVSQFSEPLTEGLVLTIEPIVSAGSGAVRDSGDGWMVRTSDRARSAHAEHTVVITDGAPIVLTAP